MSTHDELLYALQLCVTELLHDGVPTDPVHPRRVALDLAEKALAHSLPTRDESKRLVDPTLVEDGPAKGLNSVGWSRAAGIMGTTDNEHPTGPYERVLAAAIRGYLGCDDPYNAVSVRTVATYDRTIETPRRREAVEKLFELGWTYHHENGWIFPAGKQASDGPLTGKYADVLVPFVALMERELHANAGKGDRPGWLSMTRNVAVLEIHHHVAKLQKAVLNGDIEGVCEYAADVANMSMMAVDVCGGLLPAPVLEGAA